MPMVKIGELNLDGKYQFMPDLPEDEFQALKEDIREWGIQTPPEIDEDYRPLDGWNRIKICQELGISEIPVVVRDTGLSEEMKIEQAIALNIARRQITNEEKKNIFYKVREGHPEYPLRQIAKILGVGKSTVNRWDNKCPVVPNGTTGQHKGSDGKTYEDSKETLEIQRDNIRQAIQGNSDKSDRQIARETGASPTTVVSQRKVMEEMDEPDDNDILLDADDEEFIPKEIRHETKGEGFQRALIMKRTDLISF